MKLSTILSALTATASLIPSTFALSSTGIVPSHAANTITGAKLMKRSLPFHRRQAVSCTPSSTVCDFYTCLDTKEQCGPQGYLLGYGNKFCNKFNDSAPKFTPKGQVWLNQVRLCLQQSLVPFNASPKTADVCDVIHHDAFNSHPRCYVNSGLCMLPPQDLVQLVEVVGLKEMLGSIDAIKQIIGTGAGCIKVLTKAVFDAGFH